MTEGTYAGDGSGHSPGQVVDARRVRIAFLGLIPQRVSAWRIRYWSCDFESTPEIAVTTVLVPRRLAEGRPIVSYQCAIDAMAEDEFPSRALTSRRFGISTPRLEYLTVASCLRRGWIVSLPDHEGPDGMWGAAREPGFRALDAVRACIASPLIPVCADSPVTLWGYSGGGLATGWAAEVSGTYAPELRCVGAVLGSPVGDPEEIGRRLDGTVFAGLVVVMIAALAQRYPAVRAVVDRHATLAGAEIIERAKTMSTPRAVWSYARHRIDDYADLTVDELWALPELRRAFDDIRLGSSAPPMPMLVYQAIHDPVIAVDIIDDTVERYRSAGADVTYVRDRFSEHIALHITSARLCDAQPAHSVHPPRAEGIAAHGRRRAPGPVRRPILSSRAARSTPTPRFRSRSSKTRIDSATTALRERLAD